MSEISKIKAVIEPEMKKFEPFFKNAVKSKVPLLDIIMNYVIRRKGKQMRPMFVFLTAKMLGEVTNSTYVAASLIELLHTSSLVHDDVVDEADTRRGFFSINALWRSKIAVLVGDFLLSKGLLISVEHKEYELLEIVSEAVREMVEGELYQIEKSRKLDINEETYFEIIYKKTASLIATCTATGAKSVNASEETVNDMKLFGKYAGIAFQIKDDLFDYQKTNITGKPTGNDIKEKKMTLPLIHALQNADNNEKRKIIKIIRRYNSNADKVKEILQFVNDKGGLEYSRNKMLEYRDNALSILEKYPDSESKQALISLVNYIVIRKK